MVSPLAHGFTIDKWKARAECRDKDPELFFPERDVAAKREAKAICAGCPVKEQCLQSALDHDDRFGIWGGLEPNEIRRWRTTGLNAKQILAQIAKIRAA